MIVGFSYPGHRRNLGKLVHIIGEAHGQVWLAEVCGSLLFPNDVTSTKMFRRAHFHDHQLQPLPRLEGAEEKVAAVKRRSPLKVRPE